MPPLKVAIVGCGLGGLSCAISCRRGELNVQILEKAAKILPVGAGIQIPPNATRVLQQYGLADAMEEAGAVRIQARYLRRYKDGAVLATMPGGEEIVERMGAAYYVIHRADYHTLLLNEAERLGVEVLTDAEVVSVSFEDHPSVTLRDGREIFADVVVGADGLWSSMREQLLGKPSPPQETGDLAYRGTFSLAQLEGLNDPGIMSIVESTSPQVWM
jgi:salicylate hydroxylase